MTEATLRSPLHELHRRLGARFTRFAGWEMPLHYGSVLAEHRAVRRSAGWFDVSHLGRFRWRGRGADAALRRLTCGRIPEPGRARYTMVLNERGGVVDDMIVWCLDTDDYLVQPNAANHERVMAMLTAEAPTADHLDLRGDTVCLAVQGPDAPAVLERILGWAPRRFRTWVGQEGRILAAGTGYTGEAGGEIVCGRSDGQRIAAELVEAGVQPCGLGARDTLRLEAGLPLWGSELDEDTTPLEAGLEFVVDFDREFRGRDALLEQRRNGVGKKLVGFVTAGRTIPRAGNRLRADGSEGWVTSGNFSPMLERGIGLGYLRPPTDSPIELETRGRWVPVERTEPPFVGAT